MSSLSNFITIIKNAYAANHKQVTLPHSKFNHALAQILSDHGYLGEVKKIDETPPKLQCQLLYLDEQALITHLSLISKPGLRRYTTSDKIPYALSGRGLVILSTSQGLMTDKQARKKNLGGELICQIW